MVVSEANLNGKYHNNQWNFRTLDLVSVSGGGVGTPSPLADHAQARQDSSADPQAASRGNVVMAQTPLTAHAHSDTGLDPGSSDYKADLLSITPCWHINVNSVSRFCEFLRQIFCI